MKQEKAFYYSTHSPAQNQPFLREIWKVIDDSVIPGATGMYEVNTFGKVRNSVTKREIVPYKHKRAKSNKYDYFVKLPLANGEMYHISTARLILIAFYPIDNIPNMEVNHISGDTDDLSPYNLSWCTHAENVRFAYMNGQCSYADTGKPRYLSLTNEQLEKICTMIRDGYNYNQIAKEVGVIYQVPYRIHKGEIYKDWRDKYDLQHVPIPQERVKLSDDILSDICMRLLARESCESIAKRYNLHPTSISAIRTGKNHPDYYEKFNLASLKDRNTTRLSQSQKQLMVGFVKDNESNYDSKNDLYRDALRFVGLDVPDIISAADRQFVTYTLSKYK